MVSPLVRDALTVSSDVLRNRFAQFSGRADRREFWSFFSVTAVISALGTASIHLVSLVIPLAAALSIYFQLAMLVLLVPFSALVVRRLHDVGLPGRVAFALMMPFIGWLIVLVLCARESDGDNAHGSTTKPVGSVPVGF